MHSNNGRLPYHFLFKAMILFLVGFMGSGKSYLGRRLAAAAGLPWRDLDQVIEAHEGRTIAEIFRTDGEAYFRGRERHWLEFTTELLTTESDERSQRFGKFKAIISTGGGAPCFGDNMQWMNEHGMTIWLDPPVEVLLQRLEREHAHRPVLEGKQGDELKALVEERLRLRQPYYSQARYHITAPRPGAQDILEIIEHA
jgi:shikimate kinase